MDDRLTVYLVKQATENGWPFFPPRFFSRDQIAHWLRVDVKTLNARLQRSGIGRIPHWSGLLDIEVVADALAHETEAGPSQG